MAGLPTIANVYRIGIEWQGGLVKPVNVFHVKNVSGATVPEIAAAIGAATPTGTQKIWKFLSSGYHADHVVVTPLDGHTAGVPVPLGVTWAGDGSGDEIMNDAAVISFHTGQRGSRGRGRLYQGPITETRQSNGLLDGGDVSDTVSAWSTFHASMRSGSPSIDPVVASYKWADSHSIVSIRVDSVVGSQRRRLDQRRG